MKHIVVAICTILVCGLIFSACERPLNIIDSVVKTDNTGGPPYDDGSRENIDVGDAPDPDIEPHNPESDTQPEEG